MLKLYFPILVIGLVICSYFDVQAQENKRKKTCKDRIEEACYRAGEVSSRNCMDRHFSSKEDCMQFGKWVEGHCITEPTLEQKKD